MFDRVLNTPLSFHQDHLTFVLLCRSKRRIITRHASAVLSPKKLLSNQINELHSKIDILIAELTSIIKTSSGIKVNLRNLEITGHLRGNGLDGKTVVCPKLEILRLFRINHIGDFQHLVADRLKVLHISIFQDISNKEIGWILRKRPTITKFIRCIQYSSEGIVAPKMSRSKTEKKYKPTFSGKCKSVVQLLCCQNYLIKSSKKR